VDFSGGRASGLAGVGRRLGVRREAGGECVSAVGTVEAPSLARGEQSVQAAGKPDLCHSSVGDAPGRSEPAVAQEDAEPLDEVCGLHAQLLCGP
jgi:hypothetical protein